MIYSKKQAKSEITELVNDFGKNIDLFKKSGYKEAQLENDFIRPLFGFLNWNTTNRGLEPEKQVFQLQVTGQTGDDSSKRPDYLLKVPDKNSNQMKSVFFIEAKKPSYDLKTNTKYLRQVYQYAWSTLSATNNPNERVRLALLTDFEEFRFFDCLDHTPLDPKYENKFEAFNKHIIKDWTYKNYIDKFDELWDIFEYNNVVNGSLDKWYLTEKQITENKITPDRKFLEDLKEWRKEVARSMYKNDKSLDDYQLTKATLLFINRIIFIKMLSDRNIETDYLTNILSNISKSKKDEIKLYDSCSKEFNRLDHIYNGSIFAYDADCDEVEISNNVLKNIFEELKPENSIYTLAAMPVEIIGYVYEQFIAEQIVKKGSGIALVPKYDEKKAKGVYYTPRYIVEYIVDNTLGKKLEECKSIEDAEKIKILDPACGSGSFLIVAYQRLLEWYKKISYDSYHEYINNPNEKNAKKLSTLNKRLKALGRKESYESSTDYHNISLTHLMKSNILKNCIFGVDIDQQAVMVTKFSLSIKALEDSSHDEIINDYEIFKMPLLPNLDDNIKCGNSLISDEFYQLFPEKLFKKKEKDRIKKINWSEFDGFPEIMENGGFDVIIGNPPYIRNTSLPEKDKIYFKNKYLSAIGQFDIYCLFNEKSIELCKKGGLIGFIQPNKFLSSDYGKYLLNFIVHNSQIKTIWNVSLDNVFKDASVYPYVFIYEKIDNDKKIELIYNSIFDVCNQNQLIGFSDALSSVSIIKKIELNSIKLKDCASIIKRGYPNNKIRFDIKGFPALKSTELKSPFYCPKPKMYIKYVSKDITNKAIDEVKEPVMLFPRTVLKIRSILNNEHYHILDRIYFVKLLDNYIENIPLFLAQFNSTLTSFYYNYKYGSTKVGGGYFDLRGSQISEFPVIIDIDKSTFSEIKNYINKIISLYEKFENNMTDTERYNLNKQIENINNQIDKIVYKLYDLTPEEIDIVEGIGG